MAGVKNIGWQAITLDIDKTAEYTGQDIDRTSDLCDLGQECSGVILQIPTITSAAISLLVQRDSAITTVPVPLHYRQSSDNATALAATTAGTGGIMFHFKDLGAIRYFRVYSGANQAADRTYYAKGTV